MLPRGRDSHPRTSARWHDRVVEWEGRLHGSLCKASSQHRLVVFSMVLQFVSMRCS